MKTLDEDLTDGLGYGYPVCCVAAFVAGGGTKNGQQAIERGVVDPHGNAYVACGVHHFGLRECRKCTTYKDVREFYDTNRVTCKVCVRQASRAWALAHPEERRVNVDRYRDQRYGYAERFNAQEGVCAICGKPERGRRLAVDHDHACCPGAQHCEKCVRGLVCRGCNLSLAWFDAHRKTVLAYAMFQ